MSPTRADPPASRATITRNDLERAEGRVLSPGRWANAVLRVIQHGGEPWVVKDFRPRAFLVRNTIGRLFVRREMRALAKLAGMAGVPAGAHRIDAHALAYRYVPGMPFTGSPAERRTPEFFAAFERLLAEVHARGIVHLDVRNGRNVLIGDDGAATLIDFQSHLGTSHLPRALRGWMERYDMAGVYKHWERNHPQSLGETRSALLSGMNRWRRLWPFRGYLGVRPSGQAGKSDERRP